jgi:hypothetical protein
MPPPADTSIAGLSLKQLPNGPWEAQSMAFFNAAVTPKLYSGVAMMNTSAEEASSRHLVTESGKLLFKSVFIRGKSLGT